jgi:5-methylcytosine-specific restriction protein A
MPSRPKSLCPKCKRLVDRPGLCEECKPKEQRYWDKRRGSASQRGYDSKWQKYSKAFLARPENQFCVYQFPGCNEFAQCVDHVKPPKDKDDPLFWDTNNHVASCLRCNSKKSNKII